MKSILHWLAMVILSAVVSIGCIYIYHNHYAEKVVGVNLTKYITKQQQLFLQGKITKEQLVKNINSSGEIIVHQPKRYIVILGSSVLRGKVIELDSKKPKQRGGQDTWNKNISE